MLSSLVRSTEQTLRMVSAGGTRLVALILLCLAIAFAVAWPGQLTAARISHLHTGTIRPAIAKMLVLGSVPLPNDWGDGPPLP